VSTLDRSRSPALAQGEDVAPIPGTRRVSYGSSGRGRIALAPAGSGFELNALGEQVLGDRYPDMSGIGA
jgi:hypothetical protein